MNPSQSHSSAGARGRGAPRPVLDASLGPRTQKAGKEPRGRDPPRQPWARAAGSARLKPPGDAPLARPPPPHVQPPPQVTGLGPCPPEPAPQQPVCELDAAESACPFHRRENRGSLPNLDEPDLPAPGPQVRRSPGIRSRQVPSSRAGRRTREGSSEEERGLAQTTRLLMLVLDTTRIY